MGGVRNESNVGVVIVLLVAFLSGSYDLSHLHIILSHHLHIILSHHLHIIYKRQ